MPEFLNHLIHNPWDALSGMIAWSILGHAVNTAPVPKSSWGQWLLGTVQFAVGQRTQRLEMRAAATATGKHETQKNTAADG